MHSIAQLHREYYNEVCSKKGIEMSHVDLGLKLVAVVVVEGGGVFVCWKEFRFQSWRHWKK